jgi:hypothetical protein
MTSTPRKRLTTISEANDYSNRDLLLDIALKLHEVSSKLDLHLAMHSVLNRVLTIGFSGAATALLVWFLRR